MGDQVRLTAAELAAVPDPRVEAYATRTRIAHLLLLRPASSAAWRITSGDGPEVRRPSVRSHWLNPDISREAANEIQRFLRDVAPALVDGQRMPAVWDLRKLGDPPVVLLALERRMRDGAGNRIVLSARDDQQRPAVRIAGVNAGLRPRVEVGER